MSSKNESNKKRTTGRKSQRGKAAAEGRARRPARKGADAKDPWGSLNKRQPGDQSADKKAGRGKARSARGGRGKRDGARNAHRQQVHIGVVSAHPDGFGFVDVEGLEKGIFLPAGEMEAVMHGDKVEVRTVRFRGRESGEIVRIVDHAPDLLVGQFHIQGGLGLVKPRSKKIIQNIMIKRDDANGAKDGDWVRVKIQRGAGHLRGVIQEVLGDQLSPSKLIELIIAEQNICDSFPDAVLREAEQLPEVVNAADIQGRKDLRHLPFVTIDGEDARDFDDAICVLPRGEGFETWVAIADVAHYVQPGSALDHEASQRGNSFYFPDRVIPMLPEKISNGLCSLNPEVDRLAMTVRMRFDANGRRRSVHVYQSVIHSQARLTYTQVAAYLEEQQATIPAASICAMLDDAARLFHKLEHQRARRGALDLDAPELRAQLENDQVTAISATPRNIAHRLIEEMMLAANTAVAEFMQQRECPTLYRVHTPPERESIEKLNEYLAPLGLFIALPKASSADTQVTPAAVQQVLERAAGKPFAQVLHRLVLRAMQRAQYTPANEGHFGLAYECYLHFTSPIRRYADLIVHRRLKALISGQDPNKVQHENTLAEIGAHTSTQERIQQRAEWDTQAMLAALFHAKDVGKTMSARISGLTKRRIFFELEPTMAEASLDVDALPGSFTLDEHGHALTARRGGRSYHLGDTLDVTIEHTDPVRGQIAVRLQK